MPSDGFSYAPQGKPRPVCRAGEFPFAVVGLDHGHIFGMCNGLIEAGGTLRWVYDPDRAKVAAFRERYPEVTAARSENEVLDDPGVRLVAGAAVPADRVALGERVMGHDKDYFCDKPPLTSLAQLAEARRMVVATGRKYAVYYSERLHVESAVLAGQLVEKGAIGRVVQVLGLGPHRINALTRPGWFWDKERYGGILCDIGSHQIEQVLHFTGAKDGRIVYSRVANYAHMEHPGFEDFGEVALVTDTGAAGYCRVDWFTPDGLPTWGDGRTFILGTEGYIELRKYIDIARDGNGDHLYLVDQAGETHISAHGQVGYPYFGQLILDCLERTERAMTQQHAFAAAELCLIAQAQAEDYPLGT
jgi:predicted dehydrogenase